MAGNANNIIVGSAQMLIGGVDIGYTKGGVSVMYGQEQLEVKADQAVGIVRKARTLETMKVKTTMLECTLEKLRRAFMLPNSALVSTTLTLGYNDSCWVDELAITLIGKSPSCGTRTFSFTKCITFGEREYAMKRDEEVSFMIEFECIKNSSGNFGTIVDS
jgi:hypothetical protein